MNTLIRIVDAQPAAPRTFRVCRTVDRAAKLAQRHDHSTVRFVQYGSDPRDVRFVVNFRGSNPRPSRKTSEARYIMLNGMIVS